MINDLLDEILEYEQYIKSSNSGSNQINQLREYFYHFEQQHQDRDLKIHPHNSLQDNLLTLIQPVQTNSQEQLQAIDYRLHLITHFAGIKLDSANRHKTKRQKFPERYRVEEEIKKLKQWFLEARTSIIESQIKMKNIWRIIGKFQYDQKDYGGDDYCRVVNKFRINGESEELYLWQFFDQFFAISEDQMAREEKEQSIQLNEKKISSQNLKQINNIVDLHHKFDELIPDQMIKRVQQQKK